MVVWGSRRLFFSSFSSFSHFGAGDWGCLSFFPMNACLWQWVSKHFKAWLRRETLFSSLWMEKEACVWGDLSLSPVCVCVCPRFPNFFFFSLHSSFHGHGDVVEVNFLASHLSFSFRGGLWLCSASINRIIPSPVIFRDRDSEWQSTLKSLVPLIAFPASIAFGAWKEKSDGILLGFLLPWQ